MADFGPDMGQIKAAMRATWMAGDFGRVASTVGAKVGEPFAARIEMRPGSRVLDVACGTGNVTIPLAPTRGGGDGCRYRAESAGAGEGNERRPRVWRLRSTKVTPSSCRTRMRRLTW